MHENFRAACLARRLLEDDGEWVSCPTEVVRISTGASLRILFVSAIVHGEVMEPHMLWEQFCTDICDDLLRRLHDRFPNIPPDFVDPHINYGLYMIAQGLWSRGLCATCDFLLPLPACSLTYRASSCRHQLISVSRDLSFTASLSPMICSAFVVVVTYTPSDPASA